MLWQRKPPRFHPADALRLVGSCHHPGRYDRMSYHLEGVMAKAKIAITLDADLLEELDALIAANQFPNRSQAIEIAVAEKLAHLARGRLARECAKLDPLEEKALAEEGLRLELSEWPEY
jgi:Arc/MetJ-type ribon-helix-helix transcriptional regulator